VFYIGGTKNGAMLGEAVVITNDDIKNHLDIQSNKMVECMPKVL
jgi:threonine aldolase